MTSDRTRTIHIIRRDVFRPSRSDRPLGPGFAYPTSPRFDIVGIVGIALQDGGLRHYICYLIYLYTLLRSSFSPSYEPRVRFALHVSTT